MELNDSFLSGGLKRYIVFESLVENSSYGDLFYWARNYDYIQEVVLPGELSFVRKVCDFVAERYRNCEPDSPDSELVLSVLNLIDD